MEHSISDEEFNKIKEIKKIVNSDKNFGLDLPIKEFVKCISFLTPQAYGIRIEKRIIKDLKAERVSASDDKGDMISKSNIYSEIKGSLLTDSNNALNIVQIRPWQEVDYYFLVAFDLRDLKNFKSHAFLLTKSDMLKEIEELNFNAAHGTKKAIEQNENIEYRYSLKIDEKNKIFLRWQKMYGVNYNNLDEIINILEKEK